LGRWITIFGSAARQGAHTMNKSGIVLIVIGVLFLAYNFGLLEFGWLRQWWPLILIGLGVWSLVNHKPGDKQSSGTDNKPQS
jgi:hypothetical protein